MQLLNSYCLKKTHTVKCRTDAVNNISWSLENHFIEANIYKNIRINDTTLNSVSTSAWLCATSNMKKQWRRLQVNLPNFSSCCSNFIKSFIKIFETLVEYICCEKVSADDIATGEAARMSDTRDWTEYQDIFNH